MESNKKMKIFNKNDNRPNPISIDRVAGTISIDKNIMEQIRLHGVRRPGGNMFRLALECVKD